MGKYSEPSCGTGHFFGRMPPDMMEQSVCVGIELDSITGNIAKILYENSDIFCWDLKTYILQKEVLI